MNSPQFFSLEKLDQLALIFADELPFDRLKARLRCDFQTIQRSGNKLLIDGIYENLPAPVTFTSYKERQASGSNRNRVTMKINIKGTYIKPLKKMHHDRFRH